MRRISRLVATIRPGDGLGKVRHSIDDVFGIIKHKQNVFSAYRTSNRFRRNVTTEFQPERGGNRGRHEIGVGQRGEFYDPASVFEVGKETASSFDRERRFSDSPRTREGHHPIRGDKVSHRLPSLSPTDKLSNQ